MIIMGHVEVVALICQLPAGRGITVALGGLTLCVHTVHVYTVQLYTGV